MLNDELDCNDVVELSLVVPVYNEAEAVDIFIETIVRVFDGDESVSIEMVFVNDGSQDETLERLQAAMAKDSRVRIVDLSRNFGKEAALSAGLKYAVGKVVVPLDVDLQDPPELIPAMIDKWREGYDVVLGRRVNRDSDTWIKRSSANLFYRVHNKIASPTIPENVGDFRLMDRSVVDVLNEFPESRRFMKGLFSWVGFRTVSIDYVRPERSAGESKFNGWKLWNFALEGFTSFSTAPLRIWTYLGLTCSFFSLLYAFFIAIDVILHGVDVPGYASLIVAITLLGGLQLIGVGVLGEYLGRTYIESKRRPVFVVRRTYGGSN